MSKVRAYISVSLDGVGPEVNLEPVRVIEAPGVMHLWCRANEDRA